MTNWEKIQDSVHMLFPWMDKKSFALMIYNSMLGDDNICEHCVLQKPCMKLYFQTDDNGNYIFDENGEYIENDDFPGCDTVILNWLDSDFLKAHSITVDQFILVKNAFYQNKLSMKDYCHMIKQIRENEIGGKRNEY